MSDSTRFNWHYAVRFGLLAGVIALSASAIGMVEAFGQRDLVSSLFTLGHLLFLAAPAGVGYLSARENAENNTPLVLVSGLIAGLFSALPLIGLVLLAGAIDLRELRLVSISPSLVDMLTFKLGTAVGSLALMAVTGILGLAGAAVYVMPGHIRRPLMNGLLWTLGVGLFSEIVISLLRRLLGRGFVSLLFTSKSIKPVAAAALFLIVAGVTAWWSARGERFRARLAGIEPRQQRRLRWATLGGGILLMLVLPLILGTYLTEVLDLVGVYVLMGLGLNIVVGFAGLLDLGYVAFFAIGAYTMGVLTA